MTKPAHGRNARLVRCSATTGPGRGKRSQAVLAKKLMKAQEVADLLSVSRGSVLSWSARGDLPCIVLREGRGRAVRRWDPAVVEKFIQERTVGAAR